ncbi:hypothetical protein OG943_04910 [Amycolatopsis sp. NBC_00345]|uniref:hypothetical protein n=1 Tax=Amycolatopsis sp. NBC_00345 TaxID=2975955 RepID=UPI002E25F238
MSNSYAVSAIAKIICGLAALTVLGLPALAAGMPLADGGGGTGPTVTAPPSASPDGHGWID